MKYWGLTDKGMVRSVNQDTFYTGVIRDEKGKEATLCLVCDGMGGAKAGELASEEAKNAFINAVTEGFASVRDFGVLLTAAAEAANEAVLLKSHESPDYRGMGTTLVAALVCGSRAYIANVGDSRCYKISDNAIIQLTKDHSLVEDMVDKGEISREEAWKHPRKNFITRAVGTERTVHSDLFQTELEKGSFLILCSDGLSNIVNSQEMLFEVLYGDSCDTAVKRMVDIALSRNASDNVTAVLLAV